MAITSLWFLILCVIAILLFRLSPSVKLRLATLLVANAIFIDSLLATWSEGWVLAAMAAIGFLCLRLVSLWRRRATMIASIVAILGIFVFSKYAQQPTGPLFQMAFSVIGLSYILFRILHLVVDVGQDEIEHAPNALQFLAYIFYFPAFLSGPVSPYQQFIAGVRDRVVLGEKEVEALAVRILTGLVKIMIVAPVAQQFFLYFSRAVKVAAPVTFLMAPLSTPDIVGNSLGVGLPTCVAVAAALYTIFLYYNFAGYTDCVIGVSGFLGIDLPENFDRPFSAGNVSEFWGRWHMSLSEWFKTYVFTPLVLAISHVFGRRGQSTFAACLCLFLCFLLIGLWHGSTLVFAYYALYLGAAAAVHRLYQIALGRWLGQKACRTLTRNRLYGTLCRGLTFAYFAVALFCFWMNAEEIAKLVGNLGAMGIATSVAALSLGGAIGLLAADALLAGCGRIASTASIRAGIGSGRVRMAVKTVLVLLMGVLFSSAPNFVYQGF